MACSWFSGSVFVFVLPNPLHKRASVRLVALVLNLSMRSGATCPCSAFHPEVSR